MPDFTNNAPNLERGPLDLSGGIITTLQLLPGVGWILKIRDGRKKKKKKQPITVPKGVARHTGKVKDCL